MIGPRSDTNFKGWSRLLKKYRIGQLHPSSKAFPYPACIWGLLQCDFLLYNHESYEIGFNEPFSMTKSEGWCLEGRPINLRKPKAGWKVFKSLYWKTLWIYILALHYIRATFQRRVSRIYVKHRHNTWNILANPWNSKQNVDGKSELAVLFRKQSNFPLSLTSCAPAPSVFVTFYLHLLEILPPQ